MNERDVGPGPEPKVARLIREYDLDGAGEDLEAQWTDPEDRTSLRRLADRFNRWVVRAALAEAEVDALTEDVAHLSAVLQGDEGSAGERTQIERRLERAGVDVEALTDDFVSYQAIRSYLTKHREATLPEAEDDEDRPSEARTVERLRRRTVAVTESKLERLQDAGGLEIGPHRVLADVRVLCESCGKRYDAADLIESGACECHGERTP